MPHTLSPRVARESAMLSRAEAVARLPCSRESLRLYEAGERSPTAEVVWRMVEVYELSANQAVAMLAWWGSR